MGKICTENADNKKFYKQKDDTNIYFCFYFHINLPIKLEYFLKNSYYNPLFIMTELSNKYSYRENVDYKFILIGSIT